MEHSDEAIQIVRSVRRVCRGELSEAGRQVVIEKLEAGDLEAARRADAANRERCGQDINELILAQPLDGEPKEAECPGCGRSVRWTPVALDG